MEPRLNWYQNNNNNNSNNSNVFGYPYITMVLHPIRKILQNKTKR